MLPFITGLLFFSIPILIVIFFIASLCRYVYAKHKNTKEPDFFPAKEMDKRKTFLIVSSTAAGTLVLIVLGITILMYLAVKYM